MKKEKHTLTINYQGEELPISNCKRGRVHIQISNINGSAS